MPYYNRSGGKIRSQPIQHDGYLFPSLTECETYKSLKVLFDAGEISELRVQPKYPLYPRITAMEVIDKMPMFDAFSDITYTADFEYYDISRQRYVTVESKGHFTDVNKLRIRLFLNKYLETRDFVLVTAIWHKSKGQLYLKELNWHWYLYNENPPKKTRKKKG